MDSDIIQFDITDITKTYYYGSPMGGNETIEIKHRDTDPQKSKELLDEIENQAKNLGATITKNTTSRQKIINAYGGGLDSEVINSIAFSLSSAAGITFFLSIKDLLLRWMEKNGGRGIVIKRGKATITIYGEDDHEKIAQIAKAISDDHIQNVTDRPTNIIQMQANQIFVNSDVKQQEVTMGDNAGDNTTISDVINPGGNIVVGDENLIESKIKDINSKVASMSQEDDKKALAQLIEDLNNALKQVPKARTEQAEAIAEQAKDLVDKATAEKPNKTSISITGEGLKAAAKNIEDILPSVFKIASQIVAYIIK